MATCKANKGYVGEYNEAEAVHLFAEEIYHQLSEAFRPQVQAEYKKFREGQDEVLKHIQSTRLQKIWVGGIRDATSEELAEAFGAKHAIACRHKDGTPRGWGIVAQPAWAVDILWKWKEQGDPRASFQVNGCDVDIAPYTESPTRRQTPHNKVRNHVQNRSQRPKHLRTSLKDAFASIK